MTGVEHMKLTYWYSQCPDDSDVYSVRARTKREAIEATKDRYRPEDWATPVKVTIEYRDAHDLMEACSNEGHHYWEAV